MPATAAEPSVAAPVAPPWPPPVASSGSGDNVRQVLGQWVDLQALKRDPMVTIYSFGDVMVVSKRGGTGLVEYELDQVGDGWWQEDPRNDAPVILLGREDKHTEENAAVVRD